MESRGNEKYRYGNVSTMASTLHWGTHYLMDKYNLTMAEAMLDNGQSFADDFHIFGKKHSHPYHSSMILKLELF